VISTNPDSFPSHPSHRSLSEKPPGVGRPRTGLDLDGPRRSHEPARRVPRSAVLVMLTAATVVVSFPELRADTIPSPELSFPAEPRTASSVIDGASVFSEESRDALLRSISEVFARSGTSIAVVTIPSKAEFGPAAASWTVSASARALLHAWSLGGSGLPTGRATSPTTPDEAASAAAKLGGSENPVAEGSGAPTATSDAKAGGAVGSTPFSPYSFGEHGILVLISRDDERIAVVPGARLLDRLDAATALARLVGDRLASGDSAAAATALGTGLGALVDRRKITRPSETRIALVLFVVAIVVILTGVSWFRRGAEGVAWRIWSAVFSGLGVAISFVLTRGVRLTAKLYGGPFHDEDRSRIVIGEW
jgi:hypothetical protein